MKSRWLPSFLPCFCALALVTWLLSYAVTFGHVASLVGRQSSTAGIAPALAVIAIPFAAGAGFAVGRLASYLLRGIVPQRVVQGLKWCSPLPLVAIAVFASREASIPLYSAERAALPRVLVDSAAFHKSIVSATASNATPATRVFSSIGKLNDAIPWEGGVVRLADHVSSLEVNVEPHGILQIPLLGIDYIVTVDAIPFNAGGGAGPALALLITGRATGRRDLLALISRSHELVYLELLERTWDYRGVPLSLIHSAMGDQIIVGPGPQGSLVYGSR